tara:strand:+ start:9831 stop:10853 length:1023 start_codon:yes stop_codon:yes gene_type:complete
MNKKDRDIDLEFTYAHEMVWSGKVKEILHNLLSRSFQAVNLIQGKEVAIKLIWDYLRPEEPLPSKKITKKQKQSILSTMEELVDKNNLILNGKQKTNFIQSMPFSYDSIMIGPYGNETWESAGDLYISGPRDKFLYDYLSNIKDFSTILLDEKALMCANYGGGPPIEMEGNLALINNQFCFLLSYAYLGILPTQIENYDFAPWYKSNKDFIDSSDLGFLNNLISTCDQNINTLFGKSPPRFLEDALTAALARMALDCDLPVSATNLSKLAGVDRKTVVNAKLSDDTDSIPPDKAIFFLNGKARNRWTENDEEDNPLGLKLIHSFNQLGMKKSFYPSVGLN